MQVPVRWPSALTIAGSDSGGGAGIQADLKTFAALRVHGLSVVTCVTAQNPERVWGIEVCRPAIVRRQLEAVFQGLAPVAAKTGMLYSRAHVRAVVEFFRQPGSPPLLVDPVIQASSGASLVAPGALACLRDELLPLATLVTPNLAEAAWLTGRRVADPEAMRAAARLLHRRHGCAVWLKGGHLPGRREALDLFWDGTTELLLVAPLVRGVRTHGTGCTCSAAAAAYLARGESLARAVQRAKALVSRAIARSVRVGAQWVLGPAR